MLTNKLNKFDPKDLQILRKLLYVSPVIDLDSNDRLLIPQEFKSVLGNAKEIVLQSIGPCIEIWERSAYEKMNEDADDIESLVSKRLGNCNGIPSASDAE